MSIYKNVNNYFMMLRPQNDMYRVQKIIAESFETKSYLVYLGLNGSNDYANQYYFMNKDMELIRFYIKDSTINAIRRF